MFVLVQTFIIGVLSAQCNTSVSTWHQVIGHSLVPYAEGKSNVALVVAHIYQSMFCCIVLFVKADVCRQAYVCCISSSHNSQPLPC